MILVSTIETHLAIVPETPGDEMALVRAAREGRDGAFAELVRRHQERVFRLVGRFFRRREDVEEIAQETFLVVWRKLDTYRARAPFENWLTRICLNCCYDQLKRRRRPECALPTEPHAAAPSHDPTAGVEVERILARLPAADRFVLLLLDGEGWSVAEIAERLGWTRVNVKVRAHRARRKLRGILEKDLPS